MIIADHLLYGRSTIASMSDVKKLGRIANQGVGLFRGRFGTGTARLRQVRWGSVRKSHAERTNFI
jgi:hypothetical protein